MALARLDDQDVLYLARDHRKVLGFRHYCGNDPGCDIERGLLGCGHREDNLVSLQNYRLLRDRRKPGLHLLQNTFRSDGRSQRHRRRQRPCPDQFDIAFVALRHVL